ncbi:uncharacterized protein A1O5_08726 [Cladophialophora psammophila CBS 110553]|uniref:Mid2 domain-containing protein n=1 Tax=Cladophialophora psammophila CBS 110553 TaxID=1182543 RepID=W9WTX7_9EURO|nr:uncharacterized protein A1O5_08726 [Cladophialophora psammophila CBS 110553]EXJ68111.1 hypothetical protein A1O5_08726 [Cladophialophora psammophila CBS 110553]
MAGPREVGSVGIGILALARSSIAHANNVARDSSEPDPNISNGTCYYSPDNQADPSYIPCGNTVFGVFTCCEAGSNCLAHNACYSNDGNTYLAGCTDPTYSDPSCPDKTPYDDQQWTGLVYCNGTSDEWTLCDDSGSGSDTVTPWQGCFCPEDQSLRNVAFSAPASIAPHISLPLSSGGTMSLFDGYSLSTYVTSTAASTTTETSSSSSTPISTSTISSSDTPISTSHTITSHSTTSIPFAASASSNPALESAHDGTGLSPGAKIGIGVGVSLGGLIALAVISAMALYIRRLKRGQFKQGDTVTRPNSKLSAMRDGQLDGLADGFPGHSGTTSELAGNESREFTSLVSPAASQRAWTRPMSVEVEGSVPKHRSLVSPQSQELVRATPGHKAYEGAQEMPVEVQEGPTSRGISQASYLPGRQVGDGLYEMPGHLPGSEFLEKRFT